MLISKSRTVARFGCTHTFVYTVLKPGSVTHPFPFLHCPAMYDPEVTETPSCPSSTLHYILKSIVKLRCGLARSITLRPLPTVSTQDHPRDERSRKLGQKKRPLFFLTRASNPTDCGGLLLGQVTPIRNTESESESESDSGLETGSPLETGDQSLTITLRRYLSSRGRHNQNPEYDNNFLGRCMADD